MNLDKTIDWLLDAYRQKGDDTRIDQECQALVDTLRDPRRMQELADQAWDNVDVPMTPREFGEFDLVGVVGAGGMGQVYRAVHRRLGRIQALKMLPADRVTDAQAMSRFQREVRAIGQLNHPSIVTVFDAGQVDGTPYLTMELVNGSSLSEVVRQSRREGKQVDVAEACGWIADAADGIQHAHDNGVLHRDIKPGNLMLDTEGQVRILDLGLAKFVDAPSSASGMESTDSKEVAPTNEQLTAAQQILGTPDYMSPEQIMSTATVDARTDVYSLSATLHFLLTGEVLFCQSGSGLLSKAVSVLQIPAPRVSERRSDVPSALDDVIHQALSKDPAVRPQTAAEFGDQLRQFARDLSRDGVENESSDSTSQTAAVVSSDRTSPPRSRNALWLLALLPLGAVLFGVLMVLTGPDGSTLKIESNDPNIKVVAKWMGEPTKMATKSTMKVEITPGKPATLLAGPWTVSVLGGDNASYELSEDQFVLSDGETKRLVVTRTAIEDTQVDLAANSETMVKKTPSSDNATTTRRPSDQELLDRLQNLSWQTGRRRWQHAGDVASPMQIAGIENWQLGSKIPVGGYVLEISPTGSYLAVATRDGEAYYILERETGQLHGVIPVRGGFLGDIAFSPDETEVLVRHSHHFPAGRVYAVDGTLIRSWQNEIPEALFHWSPNGDRILVTDREQMQMRTPAGDLVESFAAPLHGHQRFTWSQSIWSPDGSMFACRIGQTIYVYGKNGGKEKLKIECGVDTEFGFGWHPSSRYFLHRAKDGFAITSIDGKSRLIKNYLPSQIAISPDGKLLVDAAGQIHSVAGDKVGQLAVPYHNERWGNAVRWTEPGIITFFAREEPGCFKQFTPTGRIISEVEQPVPAPIIGTGWLREGDEMVSFAPSGSENRSRRNWLVKWDASGRGKSIPFKTHQKSDQLNDPVVGWNATKNWFSIPSTTGVRTFDLSGKEVSHLEPEQFLSQATWSPDGRHLATASHYASNELCIYTGEKVTKIPVELDDRSCLRWTRDAKQLLVSFRQSYHQSEQHKVVTIADKSVREFTSRCEQPLSPLGTWTVIATKDSFAFHGIDGAKREIKFDVPDRYDSYQCHWKDDESKVGIVITNWGSKQSETFIYDFAKESLTKLDTTIAARDLIWFGNSWAGMTGNEMVYRSDNDGSGGRVALPNRAFNYVFARGRLISAGQADCNPFSRDHRYMSVILNSYTGAERKAGGNLCLVDMREQKVAWTGIVFNDGQRAVLGDSGKLLVAPEEKIDRYLSYQISYPHPNGGTTRIVPLSQLQFAARIGLSRPQQIMQWVLDLGGTLKVGNDQQEITASELADARELPDVSSCIGVDLTGSRQVTRNNLDDLRLLEDLRHVRLGNVELEDWDFSFLSKLNDLETLDLSGSDATNRIGLLLPAGLVSLNLSNTDVDDLLLYDLATQDALRQLDLSGTKVTNEAVNRLRDQLPNCEIVLSNRLQRGSLGQSSDDAMVAKLDAIDWQPGASQKLDGYASTPTDLPGIKPGTWQVMTKYPHTIGNGSVSPNATYLALWYDKDSDPFVRIMERRTGRLVGMVKHMSRANFGDLTWAPDESKFIAWDLVGGDYQASIYRLDGVLISRWSTKLRGQHFGWNPDGTRILIVGEKTMEQRSPDGKLIRSFVSPLHGFNTAPHLLNPLWSPTGKKFTGVDDGKIYVYNADGGEPTHTINADGIDRAGVIWHPSEDKLLTSDGRFWDMSGNHIQFGLDQLHEQILAFSPDGQFFVTNHGEVRDLTDRVVATLDVSQLGYIQAQDVRWFKEDEITFVSFRTRGPGYSAEYSPSGTRLAEYDHPAPIVQHSMSWNPSEDNFVSVAGLTNFGSNVRERIFRWGVEPSQISSVVRLDSLTTPPAAISPDGSRYVLPRDNGPTSIFDRTGKKQYQLNIGYSGNLCSWSPDGSQLAIAQTSPVSECAVEVFQGEDKVCRFAGHAKGVRSLSWSPNGKLLCVCDGTGKVTVWGIKKADTPVFEKVGDVAYHRDNYQYDWLFDKALPCWSPDGSWLAIPTTEAVVLVSPTGEDEITLPWTENEFGTIWWHPDGQRLIAGRVLFDIPEKAKTAIRDIKQPFLFVRWAKGDAFTGVTHRQVGFWTSASAEPTMIGVPRFSRPGPANVLLTSRGVNSRRVSKTNRYLTHPLSVSRAQYAESGDLCLIDLQEQTHKWTGIAFSDGNRVQIEPTGRVVHCPKESDKYLCYVVTGVGDRIIALSQAEFASRIGLASERRLLLQLMDMGGVIRTGDGQTSSSVRDARLLPPLAQVTEVQFNRPYEIPAGKFVELAKLPALRKLDVSGSKIDARGLPFLREMKSIRVLSLAGLSVDNSFANDLPMGIEQLDVSGTDVGDFFLMDLKRFKELQHLDVRRTKVSREAVEKLRKALKGCKVVADPGL